MSYSLSIFFVAFLLSFNTPNFKSSGHLKVTEMGKYLIVEVPINGKKSNLLLDTGADVSIFNFKEAKAYAIKPCGEKDKSGITGIHGKTLRFKYASNVELLLEDFSIQHKFYTCDLSQVIQSISQSTNVEINGIIGADIMKRYGFSIDYLNRQVYFQKL